MELDGLIDGLGLTLLLGDTLGDMDALGLTLALGLTEKLAAPILAHTFTPFVTPVRE